MSSAITFDQSYYLTNNADVVLAISQGNFANALDHYNQFGGKELRAPNASFNPTYYAINNPDVLNAVSSGVFSNIFAHYQAFGEAENRAPNTNLASFDSAAYLTANTDVAAAVTAGTFTSALDHFLAFGQNENRTGSGVTEAVNPGLTFTLTTGADSGADFTGGSGDDTFVALIDDNTAANNTLDTLDVLDGGAGTDTLSITADTSGAGLALPAATISNIETVLLRNASGQDFTLNTSLIGGENSFISDRSTSNVTLTNVASGTTLEQRGNEVATNANLTATYVAAATGTTLNIKGGTTAGDIAVNGTGLDTMAITSTGAANIVGNVTTNGDVTSVTIAATSNLTATSLGVATNTGAQSLAISGAGNVSIGAFDTDFASIDAASLTGNLTATLSATVAATLTSGSGDDVISTSTTGQTGAISAGEGTDTLILTATADLNTAAEGAIYTGFETLRVADGQTANMTNVTGSTITGIQIVDASDGATVVNNLSAAQAGALTLRDFNNSATLTVTGSTTVGSNDSISITVTDGDTTLNENLLANATHGLDLTMAGVETVTITAIDQFDADALNNITGMTSLNLEGAGTFDIITGAVVMGSNGSINAGSATGAVTVVAAALATNPFAYTGSSGIDTFTDGAVGGNQVNTGAGNDVLVLTDKGNDNTSASTSVTMGAGQDDVTVNMTGNQSADDVIFVFAAGDSISDSSTTGISATLTDTIDNLDGDTAATNAGASIEIDTEVAATAVSAGAVAVAFCTKSVANGGDFFVHIASATVVNIYQDTDGDTRIEAGEFALQLTGITGNTLVAGDFIVGSGDLDILTT
jgi:hypothetical protein